MTDIDVMVEVLEVFTDEELSRYILYSRRDKRDKSFGVVDDISLKRGMDWLKEKGIIEEYNKAFFLTIYGIKFIDNFFIEIERASNMIDDAIRSNIDDL